MKDFSKVTRCLHGISDTLIKEWLEKCKFSIFWNESTSEQWCRNYFKISDFKSVGYGTFCFMLKQDNPKKYEEFVREKEIIIVDDIISKIKNVDLDNYYDDKGYLKELPVDKNVLAVISPLGSGKTFQIKKLIEEHGKRRKFLLC